MQEMSKNPSTSGAAEHSDTEIELFPPSRRKCLFCEPKTVRPCSVSYHRFPKRPEMSDVWARISGLQYVLKTSPSKRNKTFRACSLHFKDSDYVNRITGRLHPSAVPSRMLTGIAVSPRIEHNIYIDISEMKKTLKESLMNMTPTTEAENSNTSEAESNNISEDAVGSGNCDSSKTISVPLNIRKQSSAVNPDLFVDLTFEADSNNMSEVVSENVELPKTTALSLNKMKQPSAVNNDLFVDLTFGAESSNISENAVSKHTESPKTISLPMNMNTRQQPTTVNPDLFVDLTVEDESNNISEDAVRGNVESPKAVSIPLNSSKQLSAVNPEVFVDLTVEDESNNIGENDVNGNAESPKTISMPLNTRKQSSAVNTDLFVESNNISDDVLNESAVSSNTLTIPASTNKLNISNQSYAVTHELLNLTFEAENNNISEVESNITIKAKSNNIIENAVSGNESPRTIPVPFTTSKPNRRKQSFAVTRDSLDPLIVKEKKIPQLKIVLFKKKAQKKKIKK